MSDNLTKALIGVYVLLLLLCSIEGKHDKALYWAGAAVLTFAVLRMGG